MIKQRKALIKEREVEIVLVNDELAGVSQAQISREDNLRYGRADFLPVYSGNFIVSSKLLSFVMQCFVVKFKANY